MVNSYPLPDTKFSEHCLADNSIYTFRSDNSKQLHQQALDQRIENEPFNDFSTRVRNTMVGFSMEKINKIILAKFKRI